MECPGILNHTAHPPCPADVVLLVSTGDGSPCCGTRWGRNVCVTVNWGPRKSKLGLTCSVQQLQTPGTLWVTCKRLLVQLCALDDELKGH